MQTHLSWVPTFKDTRKQNSNHSDLISHPLPSYSPLYLILLILSGLLKAWIFFCHFSNAPVSFVTGSSHAKSFSVLSFKRCPWELWRDTIDQVLSQRSWLTLASVGCRHELHRQSVCQHLLQGLLESRIYKAVHIFKRISKCKASQVYTSASRPARAT